MSLQIDGRRAWRVHNNRRAVGREPSASVSSWARSVGYFVLTGHWRGLLLTDSSSVAVHIEWRTASKTLTDRGAMIFAGINPRLLSGPITRNVW